MSIKAMNWALQQATGDPRTQCLLYVIADCASPEGICWPSANHMAEKSQQSRATVYRRLGELRDMGLLETFERWIDDDGKIHFAKAPGRRPTSPEIRLNLAAEVQRERARRSPSDDDQGGDEDTPVAASDRGPSQVCDEGLSQGSDRVVAEERQGLSHCCDDNSNSNQVLNQEESPQAPQRGVIEPPLEDFQKVYPIPFTDYERTKAVWVAMTEAERREAITGGAGYAALCRQQPKRQVEDAHRWLRGRKWQGYLTAGKQAEAALRRWRGLEGDDHWTAWETYYRLCGFRGIPDYLITGDAAQRTANLPSEWPPVGRGIDAADRSTWAERVEGTGQFAAWLRVLTSIENARVMFGQKIEGARFLRTIRTPSEWPPGKSESSAA